MIYSQAKVWVGEEALTSELYMSSRKDSLDKTDNPGFYHDSARDKHYSDWMYIWNELSLPKGKVDGYSTMVGNDLATVYGASTATPATTLYIPLEFWFCRNVGLALNDRAEKHPPSCTKCMQEENMSYGYTNTFMPKMLVSAY